MDFIDTYPIPAVLSAVMAVALIALAIYTMRTQSKYQEIQRKQK